MAAIEYQTASHLDTSSLSITSIPPEIRSRIFYFALSPDSVSTTATIKTSAFNYPSLQLTSRLIHNESQVVPFHSFPLALPAIFGSNASATLEALRRMKRWQIKSIRRVELSIIGSVYEGPEAGRVIRFLKDGNDDGKGTVDMACDKLANVGLSPDVAVCFEKASTRVSAESHEDEANQLNIQEESELRELDIKITARDIMNPNAESAVGMEKMLDLESSALFKGLIDGVATDKFNSLRRISINVDLGASLKDQYGKEWAEEWKSQLQQKLNSRTIQLEVDAHHMPEKADTMQGYCKALGGDEDWWGSEYDAINAMMSMPLQQMVAVGWGRVGA